MFCGNFLKFRAKTCKKNPKNLKNHEKFAGFGWCTLKKVNKLLFNTSIFCFRNYGKLHLGPYMWVALKVSTCNF